MMKKSLSLFFLLFTAFLQSQVSESWSIEVDNYSQNSSNYSSQYQPLEIGKFSNGDLVVLTQNNKLIRYNTQREIAWKHELSKCSKQRLIVDDKDKVFMICDDEIYHYDQGGNLIWNLNFKELFKNDFLTFDAITSHEKNIYLVGHFYHSRTIFQLAITKGGNVLWKRKYQQKVRYDHEILPPKEIYIYKDRIYILAHHHTSKKSFVYSSDLLGRRRKSKKINFKLKKIKVYKDRMYAVGHLDSLKDRLFLGELQEDLGVAQKMEVKLSPNMTYEKAIRWWASTPPSKEEFEKDFRTSYEVHDFVFLDLENVLVVGTSYENPWLLKANINDGVVWNLDKEDKRYFKFQNVTSYHKTELYSVQLSEKGLLICGLSKEEDFREAMFTVFIHLFLREIELLK